MFKVESINLVQRTRQIVERQSSIRELFWIRKDGWDLHKIRVEARKSEVERTIYTEKQIYLNVICLGSATLIPFGTGVPYFLTFF